MGSSNNYNMADSRGASYDLIIAKKPLTKSGSSNLS